MENIKGFCHKTKGFKMAVSIFVLFFFCLILAVLNFKIAQKINFLKDQASFLKEKNNALVVNYELFLAKGRKNLDSDSIERVARDDFNLKKQGEFVVVFPKINKENFEEAQATQEKEDFIQRVLKKIRIGQD